MIKFSLDVLIDKKVQCLSDIIKRCPRPWKNYKTYSATYKFLIQAMTFHLASGEDRPGSHIPNESKPRSAAAEEADKPSPDLSLTSVGGTMVKSTHFRERIFVPIFGNDKPKYGNAMKALFKTRKRAVK